MWTHMTGCRLEDIPIVHDCTRKAYDEQRLWHLSSNPLGREPGGRSLVDSTAIDISEQKKADQLLLENQERLYTATAAVSNVVWTNNAEDLMQGEQPGWARFTGQTYAQCKWVGVHTHITGRRRDEGKLHQLAAELSEADHQKNEFLATLARELRNPLAPICNSLQLMRLAGGQPAAIDQASATMIEQKQHRLHVELPAGPLMVDADLTRLAQLFQNLLNNAAKYSPPGSQMVPTAWQRCCN